MTYQAELQVSQNGVYAKPAVLPEVVVPQEASSITVDRFVSLYYLPYIQPRKRSWAVDERISRQHISLAFGDRALIGITSREVEQWMEKLLAGGLAPATCNRILAVFKTICTLAVRLGIFSLGITPCTGVQTFKNYTLRERYLSPIEAQKLMRALLASKRTEALVIRLLLLTGARKSEILTARWEYVRIDLRLLIVPLSKSGKPRYIPLSDEAITLIKSLQRVQGCPWLFPGYNPEKPLSNVFLFWKQLRKELGIPDVRIHDLRHTFASCLVNTGHSLYEVQKILGHSDPKTTMRYAHLGQPSLLAAAESVSTWLYACSSRKTSTQRKQQGKGHRASACNYSIAALCSP